MIRYFAFLIVVGVFTGCSREPAGSEVVAQNSAESIRTAQVVHDGESWIEMTIEQKIDPKAPAYVVGIRDSKWANHLRWALVEQRISSNRVTTRFRLRPVDTAEVLRLDRDDFEWYPRVTGFEPVEVKLQMPDTALEPTAESALGLSESAGFATRRFGGGSAFVR